jgi:hypothetical protein
MHDRLPVMKERADNGDERSRAWVEHFLGLGKALRFRVG